jgi:N-acetylmuramoyl-L-alanine amidase
MRRWKFWAFLTAALTVTAVFQFQLFSEDTWEQWSLPLSGKIIILDPGHGGPDGGAVGGDVLEKDVALQVSRYVKDYLQEQGALVLMTREEDVDLADPGTKGYSRRKVEDLRGLLDRSLHRFCIPHIGDHNLNQLSVSVS